jgi:hypothetical protein
MATRNDTPRVQKRDDSVEAVTLLDLQLLASSQAGMEPASRIDPSHERPAHRGRESTHWQP